MATKFQILAHYSGELKKLNEEIDSYKSNNDYFYSNVMEQYSARYNLLLKKYHKSTGIPLEHFKIYDYELSNSRKTVRDDAVERFKINVAITKKLVDEQIEEERKKEVSKAIPLHQMRKCLKTGSEGCPKNPTLQWNKVFVGMPYDDKYLDSYKYGIEIALKARGLESYRADNTISNIDIMCKICEQMQICKYLIFNISGLNPNVMLELGLSYGLGKETIIIKDKETENISDIANTEYIEYSHAGELQMKLVKYFEG